MKEKKRWVLIAVLIVVGVGLITAVFTALLNNPAHADEDESVAAVETDAPQPTESTPTIAIEEEVEPEEEIVSEPVKVAPVEFLGMITFKTGEKFDGTEIGGLSAITYDAENDVYYVLSDDRGRPDDPRFYTVRIASDGSEVTFEAVTFLLDEEGKTLKAGTVDPEGIAFLNGTVFISSEGDAENYPPVNPSVSAYALTGKRIMEFTVPEKFLPDGFGKIGVRGNKAFEALTISPDGTLLTTAVENALVLDGPMASVKDESLSRLIQFDLATGQPVAEFVYVVGVIPVADASSSDDNGLPELIVLDNDGNYLALERSYVSGFGNTIQIYLTNTAGATDVSGMDALWDAEADAPLDFVPMQKTLLVNLFDLGIDPDNVEGMALGPVLEDGRQVLVLVSDNNFSDNQITQFIVLAIDLN